MSALLVLFPLLIFGFAAASPFSGKRMHAPIFDVCCNFEPFMAAPEDEKMRECVKEILGDPKGIRPKGPPSEKEMAEMAEKITCIEECTAKKYNLLDDDGNIMLDKLVEVAKVKVNETFMSDKIEEAAKDCMEEIKKGIAVESKCNQKPLLMSNCIFFKTLTSCPADQVKDKDKCDNMINDFKNGKILPHFNPPPPDN